MAGPSPIGNSGDSADVFDRLLSAMPRIAEVVNAFSSEENQRSALDALVRAIGVPQARSTATEAGAYGEPSPIPAPIVIEPSPEVDTTANGTPDSGQGQPTSGKAGTRRRRANRKWEPVRNLDFHPDGKVSLPDLADEKQPTNADQRNLLAVFWLEQIAGVENIGVGQVMAAYKACGWPEPSYPDNALQVTASRHSWIDTKDMTSIQTTPMGRNAVQHRMPIKKATDK